MEIDVIIGKKSLSLTVDNPYRFDSDTLLNEIFEFGKQSEIDLKALKVDRLIPRMIRGVAGCEGGCPADAKGMVRDGFGEFSVSYIEGGILSALYDPKNGSSLCIRVFPDFD